MAELRTKTLEVPGATLTYDVRDAETQTDAPVLLMIGSPMDASGFATLAGYFPDRTIVTYDPRGVSRSAQTNGAHGTTPDDHAADLHALIADLDAGPVDIFATSGGASNALALVAKHPEQVATLVAHEPPLATVLPDREEALAAVVDISETYQRDGNGPGMAKFIAITSIKGPIPADFADQPVDPAAFGLPAEDDGSRDNPLLGNIIGGTHYELDFEALRGASTRIVVAAGIESADVFTFRTAVGVAAGLGRKPVIFPSHHAGFLGGEFGQQGKPQEFAATLREVLEARD
jgi:pimeloyl-ACP methyl ester carboxylesterase